jgi:hypothetical protein
MNDLYINAKERKKSLNGMPPGGPPRSTSRSSSVGLIVENLKEIYQSLKSREIVEKSG